MEDKIMAKASIQVGHLITALKSLQGTIETTEQNADAYQALYEKCAREIEKKSESIINNLIQEKNELERKLGEIHMCDFYKNTETNEKTCALVNENKKLRRKIEELEWKYEYHCKPGEFINIPKAIKYGEVIPFGFAYTEEEFDAVAREMCKGGFLFVEYFDDDCEDDYRGYGASMTVLPNRIIGRVVDYNEEYFRVELCAESAMSECGKKFLEKYTKYEIENMVKLYCRFVVDHVDSVRHTGEIKRLISCYILGKDFPL